MAAPGEARPTWRGWLEHGALAGIIAAAVLLATPPHDLWPLALLGSAALYAALTAPGRGAAVATAWLAGFAINLVGNGWALDVMARFAGAAPSTSWLVLAGTCATVIRRALRVVARLKAAGG